MRIVLLLLMLLTCPSSASALERFGAFVVVDQAPRVLLLAGDITQATPLDFKKAMLRHPGIEVVVLASAGGNVMAGLMLADDVHLRGLNTFVSKAFGCYSACSYVYFAGRARLAAGELGVHQFYGDGDGGMDVAQSVVADILDILARFEVPQPVISRMLRTESGQMHVFSAREIYEYDINRGSDIVKAQVEPLLSSISANDVRTLVAEAAAPEEAPHEPAVATNESLAFAVYGDVDLYGGDIARISVADFPECVSACADEGACITLTYNLNTDPRRGPNCFLKTADVEPVRYDGAMSGAFVDSTLEMGIRVGREWVEPLEVFTGRD